MGNWLGLWETLISRWGNSYPGGWTFFFNGAIGEKAGWASVLQPFLSETSLASRIWHQLRSVPCLSPWRLSPLLLFLFFTALDCYTVKPTRPPFCHQQSPPVCWHLTLTAGSMFSCTWWGLMLTMDLVTRDNKKRGLEDFLDFVVITRGREEDEQQAPHGWMGST